MALLAASFLVGGGIDRGRLDALSTAGDLCPARQAPRRAFLLMLASLAVFIIGFTMGGLNYVVTILQAQNTWYDLDAYAFNGMGHFCRDEFWLLFAFPALVRERHHDVTGCACWAPASLCPRS